MSESQRVEGDRVYCHVCDHQWDRAQGGLQCPACESEFVEIVDSNSRAQTTSPPPVPHDSRPPQSPRSAQSSHPFHDHNPWAPDPDEDDITTFEFNAPSGRGTFSFTSRTYTIGGGNVRGSQNVAADELSRNFESMLGNILGHGQRRMPMMMGGHFSESPPYQDGRGFSHARPSQPADLFSMLFQGAGNRNLSQGPSPFDLLGAMLNPANARSGDTVFSQEAFDRVMTQLMEQNSNNAPGPASDTAISSLKKKQVDEKMTGEDGKAECSICMDSVEIGDEVTILPCNHWFHGDCVISWLREHDTCPHCRKSIASATDANTTSTPISPSSPASRRRRISRRSSSVASPLSPVGEGMRGTRSPDSPNGLRGQFCGNSRIPENSSDRPSRERRPSERSRQATENNGGGGVAGWIRSRLPFSGQQ